MFVVCLFQNGTLKIIDRIKNIFKLSQVNVTEPRHEKTCLRDLRPGIVHFFFI